MIEFAQNRISLFLMSSLFIYVVLLLPISEKGTKERAFTYSFLALIPFAVSWLINILFVYLNITASVIWCEIGMSIMLFGYLLYRMDKKNTKAFTIFIVYLIVVFILTIGMRIGMYKPWIKMGFSDLMIMNTAEFIHFISNVVMFMPFGLLPLINRKYGLRYGFGAVVFSCAIEATQLMLSIGECDIGDILGNSIGMVIGIAIAKIYLNNKARK